MNNKVKALVFGAISTIIIAAIVTIALWPTQKDNNSTQGDNGDNGDHGDGNMSDSSRLNLINLHYRITNHTLITTSTTVVFGCLILIIFFAKGYVSRQRKRKREKKARSRERERSSHSNHSSRDFTPSYSTNGTWTMMDNSWIPQQMQAPVWGPLGASTSPLLSLLKDSSHSQHLVSREKTGLRNLL